MDSVLPVAAGCRPESLPQRFLFYNFLRVKAKMIGTYQRD